MSFAHSAFHELVVSGYFELIAHLAEPAEYRREVGGRDQV